MYILSQDKKTLGTYSSVIVEKSVGGGKERRFALVGYHPGGQAVILGYFTEEEAVSTLGRIAAEIERGTALYRL